MSPGWWDRWRPPRHSVSSGESISAYSSNELGNSTPIVVLLPADWSNLWNQIRQWHEATSATRVRISIHPPLGPRRFLIDADLYSRIDVFASADILVGKTSVGRVELGYPDSQTTPLVAQSEADQWAHGIGIYLTTGSNRQDPPSKAA